MKKRLLMILLASIMAISIVTVTALADDGTDSNSAVNTTEASETPAGEESSENANTQVSTLDFTASATLQGEGWSWNADTKELKLDNLKITTTAQYAIKLPGGSTIHVPDGTTNTISTTAGYDASALPAAIYCEGDLTITGDGKINVEAEKGYAIFLSSPVSAELTVDGANVTCVAPGAKGNAVCLSSEENMAAKVLNSTLTMTSAKGLAISPMKSTKTVTVSFDIDDSTVSASGNLIYGGFWNGDAYKPGECAIRVKLTGSKIEASNGAIYLDSRDCASSTLAMSIDECDATIKGIKAYNIVGAASVDVRNTTLSMPSSDPSGPMFHIGGKGSKTVTITGSTVNMDGQLFLDDNGTSNSITDSITITSSQLSIENDGAAWTVGDGIRLGESAENANFVVSDSKLDITCEGNGVAIGNSGATVNLTLENTDTTIAQTKNSYSSADNKDKRENGYNAFKVSGSAEDSEVSITDGTIIVSSDVVADGDQPGETDLISVSDTTGGIDSKLLKEAGLVVYNDEGKLFNSVTIEDDIALPADLEVVGEAKLEVAPGVTVTVGDNEPLKFENGGSISGTAGEGITTHQHTPAAAVRENEVPATYSQPGSYDEVIYCTGCGDELSRETVTTPRLTGSSSSSGDYIVSVDSGKNGKVTVNPGRADKGDTVTITVKPNDGYELDELVVTDSRGSELKLSYEGSGKYTFKMPDSRVGIEATFKKMVIAPVNPFADVNTGNYYYDAVLWAVENGVTNGTSATSFGPNLAVSRAQMVTFLWRANGSPKATGTNPFTDVSESDYYYDAVLWAVANGVTNGTSATTFSPETAVTRAQAVTFQWRAAGSPVVTSSSFGDVAADAYYVNAVSWAAANGITAGTSATSFSPDVVVSRAQAVTFLYRELTK